MHETLSQITYSKVVVSYYQVQPPPNPSFPPTHFQSQPVSDPYSSYGDYPPPDYATFQPQPSYYSDPNAIPPAFQPLQSEAIPSGGYGTPMNTFGQFPNVSRRKLKKPKVIKKKKSASESVFCNLCKIECNSGKHDEKHILGGEGGPGVSSVPTNLEEKKQKHLDGGTTMQSLRLCNAACNGEIGFSDHLIGKKHIAKEPPPSLKRPYSTMIQEEEVLSHRREKPSPCTHCGKYYHTEENCYDKHGYKVVKARERARGRRGGTGGRGIGGRGRGRGRGYGNYQANAAGTSSKGADNPQQNLPLTTEEMERLRTLLRTSSDGNQKLQESDYEDEDWTR